MPLYEYQCTACGKLTEKRQKFSDPEITDCPLCGGRLERTITAPAVQFKGGGWYADLYSSGKKPAANASSDKGTDSKSGDAAKGSGESPKSEGGGKSDTGSASPGTPAAPTTSPSPAK